ncbi:MAG TPA: A/G-specific adenine glycosylase [Phycisphaerae bacterium]|nr:A/G-specific adenine glycosylase [Phycisphaerae bacterium]
MKLSPKIVEDVRKRLLDWYRRHCREMPWRQIRDPYAIWISEIMLQQTRVTAVVPYFRRFLERFPDAASLARARLDDVLKAWEGLGYYSRARNLHAAAKRVVADFGGALPRSVEQLRSLPGVGQYTAGAIASIAFGLDEPVLDGNVTRVLCRLLRVESDPRSGATVRGLWAAARRLVPRGKAGLFNQAMMDLGATVCTPRNPRCGACPLATPCRARAAGVQEQLPRKASRKPLPHHTVVCAIVRRRGRILLGRRREEGLLGGLWEFPGGKVEPGESLPQALAREVREEVGLDIRVGERLAVVEHAYTHFRITLHAFDCRADNGRARALGCQRVRWVRPNELDQYAFPRANRRILQAITEFSI